MKYAYADPPYLGCGKKIYGQFHDDAADWDNEATHVALIERLCDEYPDGWAVSLHCPSLPLYAKHVPTDARYGAWCKTWHQIRPTTTQWAWEPVIWRTSYKDNKRSPMVRDYWVGAATRQRGLPGAKPDGFCRWIIDLLGYKDGDQLDDLFPGTGIMGRTAAQLVI